MDMQIVQETEWTGRIAQGHEILQEGNLHPCAIQQHVGMPDKPFAFLEEVTGQLAVRFPHSDGESEVGWAKADADAIQQHGFVKGGCDGGHAGSFCHSGVSEGQVRGTQSRSAKKRARERLTSRARLWGKSNSRTLAKPPRSRLRIC